MKKINDFFWYCSGSDYQLLKKSPTDSSKYSGVGGTVFFTAIFASLAAGYALYTVFDNWIIASITGLLWGLMIFNLDRYIVSSMRKNGSRWQEMFMALPRVLLAVLISIVVAKPLELKLFEKEIDAELQVMEQEYEARLEGQVTSRYEPVISKINDEIDGLKAEVLALAEKRDKLYEVARAEADGTGGTKRRNAGPIYRLKKADADKAQLEFDALNKNNQMLIEQKLAKIADLDSAMQNELNALEEAKLGGLASRLSALDRLTSTSDAIWLANLFIIMLFIAVETAPILVKLISTKGPYDHLLATAEYKFEADTVADKAFIHDQLKKRSEKYARHEKEFVTESLNLKLDQ